MAEDSNYEPHNVVYGQREYFDIFTWKIPNVSSIPHIVDYVVQSPSFSFYDATWILKMYPYGHKKGGSEGYVDVTLETLDRDREEDVFIRIFSEDVFGKKFFNGKRDCTSVSRVREKTRFYHILRSLKDNPEKWRLAPNDTFSVICALGKVDQQHFKSESIQQNLSKRCRLCKDDEIVEIGEICKEYSAVACFMVKICDIKPVPAGYAIRIPFSFANADWILKIYPYFQVVNSNEKSFDIVLERLHSEISEQYVFLQIIMTSPEQKGSDQSIFVNAHRTQGDAMNFQHPAGARHCIHFDMHIRMKNISGVESDSQAKSIKPDEGGNRILGSSAVLRNIHKLYLQQEDCDVVFKVKEKEFKAHRLILIAQSPVFAAAFRIDMKEKATGIYNIEDCEPSIFSDFLHFLYCGEVQKLSKDNVFDLFTITDKYDIPDLKATCMEFIEKNLSVETFCDTIALALLHSEELIKVSTDFFAKNLQEIIVTIEWQSFIVQNPIQGNKLLIKALVPSQRDKDALKKM